MNHLPSERLLQLGVDRQEQPTASEASHLASCPHCADELADERRLTESLMEIPLPEPDAGFVTTTCARFERAVSMRRARAAAMGLLLALGLGLLAAILIVGLVIANFVPIAHGMAAALQHAITIGTATATVVETLPIIPTALIAITSAVALSVSTLLGRLALTTVEVK